MLEALLMLTIALLIAGFGAVLFFVKKRGAAPQEGQALTLLQNQISEMRRVLDTRLEGSEKSFQHHSAQSMRIIENVTEKLTRLDETNKQVLGFSDQIRNLQDILKNPKQRGVLGEYYLETLLKGAFNPTQYQMQYKFKSGDIVDAALFLGDKVIPVDSKFSLENYNRIVEERNPTERERLERAFKQDLKNRIDETSKYIRPQEGTTEFAFMFIPAEGIYYDLLVNQIGTLKSNTRDLIDYAIREKNVHIVSPTTFYVTLQALGQGERAYQIQESTKEILKNVGLLERHLRVYGEHFTKLGAHLGTAVSTYNKTSKEFGKIDKDILRLGGSSMKIEPSLLDPPVEENAE